MQPISRPLDPCQPVSSGSCISQGQADTADGTCYTNVHFPTGLGVLHSRLVKMVTFGRIPDSSSLFASVIRLDGYIIHVLWSMLDYKT